MPGLEPGCDPESRDRSARALALGPGSYPGFRRGCGREAAFGHASSLLPRIRPGAKSGGRGREASRQTLVCAPLLRAAPNASDPASSRPFSIGTLGSPCFRARCVPRRRAGRVVRAIPGDAPALCSGHGLRSLDGLSELHARSPRLRIGSNLGRLPSSEDDANSVRPLRRCRIDFRAMPAVRDVRATHAGMAPRPGSSLFVRALSRRAA
mgnify:CR=1 FL=1